jgi:hypothetical protein
MQSARCRPESRSALPASDTSVAAIHAKRVPAQSPRRFPKPTLFSEHKPGWVKMIRQNRPFLGVNNATAPVLTATEP